MKKWEEQQRMKNHATRIINAKPTLGNLILNNNSILSNPAAKR